MRVAVISDVHGNLEALRAVLRAARRDGIRRIVCLGDLVGYHAFPAETVALLRAGGALCVAGSHDLMAAGRLATAGRGLRAGRAMQWTRSQLGAPELSFLAGLPGEVKVGDTMLFLHSALRDPWMAITGTWQYYELARDIRRRHPGLHVCFHSRGDLREVVEVTAEGEVFIHVGRQHVLRKDSFYFVSPGSVGSPTGGDYRAAYAVYDTATGRLSFRRTTYDRLRVMQENIRHGLTGNMGLSPVHYLRVRAVAVARSLKTRLLEGIPGRMAKPAR